MFPLNYETKQQPGDTEPAREKNSQFKQHSKPSVQTIKLPFDTWDPQSLKYTQSSTF